ncbi:MAG: hypothetical protein KC613_12815 [Myxococcales bacterium]|nr:hypothetical protein [Myxococcales bacterium]MCB9526638.1 hypothetical protein [Myxococcales bacterium]
MFKRTLAMLTLGLAALTFATPAQAGAPKIGAQGAFVLPTGDWGDFQGIGFGALLNVDYGIDAVQGLQLTGRTGLIHFLGKEIEILGTTVDGPTVNHIPLFVGAKYFFAAGVYGGLEIGPNFIMPEEGDTEVEFGFTAGLGYMIKDIDLRAFLYLPSLFPEGDDVSAFDIMGIGLTAGYRFWAP